MQDNGWSLRRVCDMYDGKSMDTARRSSASESATDGTGRSGTLYIRVLYFCACRVYWFVIGSWMAVRAPCLGESRVVGAMYGAG